MSAAWVMSIATPTPVRSDRRRSVEHAFSCQQLVEGQGFGARREQMLDAFAGLLVELLLAGRFWGDCSLANVLYRFDAEAIEPIMIDAETSVLREALSRGPREEDLEIMSMNVAGGMADIAAAQDLPLDEADLALGDDPRSIAPNLDAQQIDGQEQLERHWGEIHRQLMAVFDWGR